MIRTGYRGVERAASKGTLNKILYALLLFPHFKPAALEHLMPMLESIFDVLRLLSAFIILYMYIYSLAKKRLRINALTLFILLYELALLFSTWYNGGEYWIFINGAGSRITMCLLVELMLRKDAGLCLDVMLPLLELLVYANLLTILLYPNGMYSTVDYAFWGTINNWLLGYDNVHILVILPALTLSLLRTYYYTGKARLTFRNWMLLVAGYTSILINWPATSVAGLIIFAFYITLPGLFLSNSFFSCRKYIVFNIIFFVGIVLLRFQDYLSFFIEDVLGKSLTFTGRTIVWDSTMFHISLKPWLGSGVESRSILFYKILQVNAHNQYLWDLYRGGIVHFSFFIVIIALLTHKLMRYKNDILSKLLSITVFIILLMWQVEAFGGMMFFAIFVFAFNIDEIISQRDTGLKQAGSTTQ